MVCRGKEEERRKKRKIFGEGIYLSTEEKKNGKENIWKRKIFSPQRRKIFVHVGEKTIEKEKDEIFGEGKTE